MSGAVDSGHVQLVFGRWADAQGHASTAGAPNPAAPTWMEVTSEAGAPSAGRMASSPTRPAHCGGVVARRASGLAPSFNQHFLADHAAALAAPVEPPRPAE